MPELPEVETIKNELLAFGLVGKEIEAIEVFNPSTIAEVPVEVFSKAILGKKVTEVHRRGKYIQLVIPPYVVFVHLRMTGKFLLSSQKPAEIGKHERLRITFKGGLALSFDDTRKFGRWYLVKDSESISAKLGLEPLSPDFTIAYLQKVLSTRSRAIKPLLLDQTLIAGLGNIYVDEALWLAKIHPLRPAASLTKKEMQALHHAIRQVLEQSILYRGTSLGEGKPNYQTVSGTRGGNQHHLKVYGNKGKSCERCLSPISKTVVAQRGTHFCPVCQIL